jgi:hypothetical protein
VVAVHVEDDGVRAAAGAGRGDRRGGGRELPRHPGHRGVVDVHQGEDGLGAAVRAGGPAGRRRGPLVPQPARHPRRLRLAVPRPGLHPRPRAQRHVLRLALVALLSNLPTLLAVV